MLSLLFVNAFGSSCPTPLESFSQMRLTCVVSFVFVSFFSFCLASCLGLILYNRSFSYSVFSARLCLPRQILVWCDVVSLVSAPLVGHRLFGRSWLSSHMVFFRVACVIASRLDLACLLSPRRGLCDLILCRLVWMFFLLSSSLALAEFCFASLFCLVVFFLCFFLFCCLVPPCLEPCVGDRFLCVCRLTWRVLPLVSSGVPYRFAVGIGCFCPRYLCATLLYESPRRKPG